MSGLHEVSTDRLILRRMKAEDWAAQRCLDGDPRVMATLGGLRLELGRLRSDKQGVYHPQICVGPTRGEKHKDQGRAFIPCHPDFEAYMDALKPSDIDDYIFKNPRGRMPGKRYTIESLNVLWKKACAATGEDIDLYSGLKHSSCSQYVNEKGLSIYDLQELTDHARLESVKRYAKVSMARKKEMMRRGKVIELKSIKGKKEKD